jgi:hypothetical protein
MDEVGFCLDCHNERTAQLCRLKRLELFPREIVVEDASGRPHRLAITNLLMGGQSEWSAEEGERRAGYRFSVFVQGDEDEGAGLQRLMRDVLAGLQHQTLQRLDNRHTYSNAMQTADGQFNLSETGCGRIEAGSKPGEDHLIIDGRPVSGADFVRMLTTYEGFNLVYQVRDLSDGVLEKDMALMQVSIDAKTVVDRFYECLGWFLDGSFLSYKREAACTAALLERLGEFELFCRHGKRELARPVGGTLIDRLLAVEHDTEDFPDFLVDRIEQIMPEKFPLDAED